MSQCKVLLCDEVSKLPLLLFEMFAFSKPNNTFNFGFPKELLVGALGLQVETCSILAMVVDNFAQAPRFSWSRKLVVPNCW
jgi:hypothetical protein